MSDELLSAYLDNELTDAERAQVESDLATSATLRLDLAELEATRALLRGLPQLQPSSRWVPRAGGVPARPRRPRRLGLAVAAVAAVWLLILSVGVSLDSLPIVPDVDQLAVQHAAAETGEDPMGFAEMDADKMMDDDPAIMADIGHGMGLEGVFQLHDLVQARYSDGVHAVSVFHEPGEVDWGDMPGSGKVEMMDEGPVWRSTMGDVEVLVTERGSLVVIVVSDGDIDGDMAMAASTMVPEVDMDRSLWSRIKDAPGNLFDRF